MLTVRRILLEELALQVFESALEVEEVPARPTIEGILCDERTTLRLTSSASSRICTTLRNGTLRGK